MFSEISTEIQLISIHALREESDGYILCMT